jgi:hypothetical protein
MGRSLSFPVVLFSLTQFSLEADQEIDVLPTSINEILDQQSLPPQRPTKFLVLKALEILLDEGHDCPQLRIVIILD